MKRSRSGENVEREKSDITERDRAAISESCAVFLFPFCPKSVSQNRKSDTDKSQFFLPSSSPISWRNCDRKTVWSEIKRSGKKETFLFFSLKIMEKCVDLSHGPHLPLFSHEYFCRESKRWNKNTTLANLLPDGKRFVIFFIAPWRCISRKRLIKLRKKMKQGDMFSFFVETKAFFPIRYDNFSPFSSVQRISELNSRLEICLGKQ